MNKLGLIILILGIPLLSFTQEPNWVKKGVCEEKLCAVGSASKKEGKEKARENALIELSAQLGTKVSSLTAIYVDNERDNSKITSNVDAGYKNIANQIIDTYESGNRIYVKVKYLAHEIISTEAMISISLDESKLKEKNCRENNDENAMKDCERIGIAFYHLEQAEFNRNARFYLKKACDSKLPKACYYLGEWEMSFGEGGEPSYKTSLEWSRNDNGDRISKTMYPPTFEKAKEPYKFACEHNILEACVIYKANVFGEESYRDLIEFKDYRKMLKALNIAKFGCSDPKDCDKKSRNFTHLCKVKKEPFACEVIGEKKLALNYAPRGGWKREDALLNCGEAFNIYSTPSVCAIRSIDRSEFYDQGHRAAQLAAFCYRDKECLRNLEKAFRYSDYDEDYQKTLDIPYLDDEFFMLDSETFLERAERSLIGL